MSSFETESSTILGLSAIVSRASLVISSIHLYPQILLNKRNSSVRGLSIDYLYLNIIACGFYSAFAIIFTTCESTRNEYLQKYGSLNEYIHPSEAILAIHAFCLSAFLLFQTTIYEKSVKQKLSSASAAVIWAILMGAVLIVLSVRYGNTTWADVVYYFDGVGYFAAMIKYLPLVKVNSKRKSTIGWSIQSIILDLLSGLLLGLQSILDSTSQPSDIIMHPAKCTLAIVIILFDLVFLYQHFVLYAYRRDFYYYHHQRKLSYSSDYDSRYSEHFSFNSNKSDNQYGAAAAVAVSAGREEEEEEEIVDFRQDEYNNSDSNSNSNPLVTSR
ncbi:hypothetical protein J3Q64DRAFT_1718301 [Phycomyces blakesleeanus]|uniref:Cystinosin n=1 Tax=Phycomyces blakesleeanus TaxID=4837 RepID=A0ABR3B873_PHYBL